MSQDIKKIIGENVTKLRQMQNLKKEELSLLLDFDNSYISKLEKGRINITIEKLQKIATFFNVHVSDLLH